MTPSDGWSRKRLLIELGVQVDSSGPTSFASGLSELQTPPSPPYSAHRSTYNGTNLSPSKRGSGAYSRSASARSDSYTLAGSIHAPQNHRSSQQRATSTPADPHSGRELSGIYSRKGSSSSSVQPARPVSAQSLSYDTDYISQQRHGRSFTEQPNTSWDGSRESAQSQLLDALYARLISHLQTTLPPLIEQAVLFQQNRFLHGITTNPIPPDNEWRAWSLPRSIHYLYDSPPPSLHNSLKKSGHAQSHPLFRLAEFATLNGRGQPVRSGCDIPRWEWVLIAEALTMLYAEDVVLDFRQQLDQAWAGGVR